MEWWIKQLSQAEIAEFLQVNGYNSNSYNDALALLEHEGITVTDPIYLAATARNVRNRRFDVFTDDELVSYLNVPLEGLERIKDMVAEYKKVTVSVASLNVQFYKDDKEGKIIELINNYDVDVFCTQEDLKSRSDQLKEALFYFPAATCIGQGQSDRLMNSIYTKLNVSIIATNDFNLETPKHLPPRCGSTVTIKKHGNTVKITNLHLTGGRYDDEQYYRSENVKEAQIKQVFKGSPSIIVGDFNSEIEESDALTQLAKYPLYEKLNIKDKKKFLTYYQSWANEISKANYHVAFQAANIGPTSRFGGNPDWCLYRDGMKPVDLELIDVLSGNPQITDHNGFIIDFFLI